MIIGTAGHVDHGKSALVGALTGRAMDRLAEEKRRGITIDLGFAPFPLSDGRIAGVVDVPGHEDFVRTMVAGASGIDLALLVVAADEGIMPQTLEHLLVLEQVGVTAGIPVITKTDLADPEWLELVVADVGERLAASRVRFEEPARVSARTGAGIPELRQRIEARLRAAPARTRDDLFRLPVDRVFSVAGIGTVVTGTCWSGTIGVGDEIRFLPDGPLGRVRSTEAHGAPSAVRAGARTAIGVAGLDRASVGRGSIAVAAGAPWIASRVLDAEIEIHASASKGIARRQQVRLLLGTGEWIGWARPRAPVPPGSRGMARITLDREIVSRGGDRFVLRSMSPARTIGGGEVMDPAPPSRGAPLPATLAVSAPADRMTALIGRRRFGVPAHVLPVLLGHRPAECGRLAEADPRVTRTDGQLVLRSTIQGLAARVAQLVDGFHSANPAEQGMPLETLRQGLRVPSWLANAAIDLAASARAVVATDGAVAARDFRPSGAGSLTRIDAVVAALVAAGLTPPTVAELATREGWPDVAASLRSAAAAGRAEAVERDRYYARSVLDSFIVLLEDLGTAGTFGVGAVRDRTGLSRKFLIPLLEWCDARGVTVRTGDVRRYRGVPARVSGPEPAARVGPASPA